jgi:hypothetical protein
MKRVLVSIIIIGLVMFPSMPIMHAEEYSEPRESHCCHDCEESQDHDMQNCINAVQDISAHQKYFSSEVPEKYISNFISWKKYILPIRYIYPLITTKSQDPPFFSSQSLVGIVKLTT